MGDKLRAGKIGIAYEVEQKLEQVTDSLNGCFVLQLSSSNVCFLLCAPIGLLTMNWLCTVLSTVWNFFVHVYAGVNVCIVLQSI